MRHERSPHTRVHQNIFLVIQPQIILRENLRMCAKIIASIVALHKLDVRHIGKECRSVRRAVKDEHEIGFGVQAMINEKYQVLPRFGCLAVHVCY